MKLFALSDLHVNHPNNRATLEQIPAHVDDWLILGGDLGETEAHLRWVLDLLQPRWKQIVWVPGNHELWTPPSEGPDGLRGVARYERFVEICRSYGVLTPEDRYVRWTGEGPDDLVIAPMFLLYDYSWAPDGVDTPEAVIQWARQDGIMAMDERLLHPDPHTSRQAWCAARVAHTAGRLEARQPGTRTVLINHWPLRKDLCRIFKVPRYTPWCGTHKTNDWHVRFNAHVVVTGHLHMRATDWRNGTRFEEVALGYPRHWRDETGAAGYLREILPGVHEPAEQTIWHR